MNQAYLKSDIDIKFLRKYDRISAIGSNNIRLSHKKKIMEAYDLIDHLSTNFTEDSESKKMIKFVKDAYEKIEMLEEEKAENEELFYKKILFVISPWLFPLLAFLIFKFLF